MTVAGRVPGAATAAVLPAVPCCRGRPAEAAAAVVGAGGEGAAEDEPASLAPTRDPSSAENPAASQGCQRTSSAAAVAAAVAVDVAAVVVVVVVVQSEVQVQHLIQLTLFHCQLNTERTVFLRNFIGPR